MLARMSGLGSFAVTMIAGILLLGGLVFFHELGHFLAAKAFKVKVLKFSLGFGPRVWGFRRGETEYQLAALPLGGFVKMAGEDPSQPLEPEDRGRGFNEQKPWKRAIIAFAGPFVNLVLPVAVFFAVLLSPQPQQPALVGVVMPGEPAERAGVRAGDIVRAVDGIPVRSFDEMKREVESRGGQNIDLVVERDGERKTLTLTPTSETETNPIETTKKGRIGIVAGKFPAYIGVVPGGRADQAGLRTFDRVVSVNGKPVETAVDLKHALADANQALTIGVVRSQPVDVPGATLATAATDTLTIPAGEGSLGIDAPDLYLREVTEGTPAFAAGLRPLDRIIALNGTPVASGPRLERVLDEWMRVKGKRLDLVVQRGAEKVSLSYDPVFTEKVDPMLGPQNVPELGFKVHSGLYRQIPFKDSELISVRYGPGEALSRAVDQTIEVNRAMALSLKALFTGQVSTRSIGSPIMVFQLAGDAARTGLATFLSFFALISVNLGLVNLLPVPVLDGFHIVVAGIEGISRRPLPQRAREVAQYVGLAMLLLLMVLAFTNDIRRLIGI